MMSKKYVTFIAKNEEFGIPVEYVNFIELPTEVTKIPNSPEAVIGISTLRGNVVPIIDVNSQLFNESIDFEGNQLARIIGVHINREEFGLLVEEAREIIDIDENCIQQIDQGGQLYQVANLKSERLVLITEPEKLINREEIDSLRNEINQVEVKEI